MSEEINSLINQLNGEVSSIFDECLESTYAMIQNDIYLYISNSSFFKLSPEELKTIISGYFSGLNLMNDDIKARVASYLKGFSNGLNETKTTDEYINTGIVSFVNEIDSLIVTQINNGFSRFNNSFQIDVRFRVTPPSFIIVSSSNINKFSIDISKIIEHCMNEYRNSFKKALYRKITLIFNDCKSIVFRYKNKGEGTKEELYTSIYGLYSQNPELFKRNPRLYDSYDKVNNYLSQLVHQKFDFYNDDDYRMKQLIKLFNEFKNKIEETKRKYKNFDLNQGMPNTNDKFKIDSIQIENQEKKDNNESINENSDMPSMWF